jgi:hypothetical protein
MIFLSNPWLFIGAILSAIASLVHLTIIVGGAEWYRFFGAGERLAQAAAAGRWYPAVVTFGIAAMLMLWAAYALSAAGLIAPLPWTQPVVILITAVYLLRAAFGLAAVFKPALAPHHTRAFVLWSSLICLVYGVVHLLGVMIMLQT